MISYNKFYINNLNRCLGYKYEFLYIKINLQHEKNLYHLLTISSLRIRTGWETIICSRCFSFSLKRDGRNVDVEDDKITLSSTILSRSL